jgi:hypothetical protein
MPGPAFAYGSTTNKIKLLMSDNKSGQSLITNSLYYGNLSKEGDPFNK